MNGQQSFFEGSQRLKIDKPIRLIELFAGIGAQAKALENLNVDFEHYRICEFDTHAVRAYNAVHGTNFEVSDITKIHAEDLAVTDTNNFCYIMTYSFPCTDLSTAGKMAGMSRESGTRSGLLWEVERLLKEMDELPQILLMENVPEVISDKNIHDFAEWIAFLDGLGYMSKYKVLNAKNYGVPQNRDRCFMVSWLGDFYYDFPEPVPLTIRLMDVLEPEVDEKYYLSDKQIEGLVRAMDRDHKPTMLDYPQREREMRADEIREEENLVPELTVRVRRLTPKECWRLMGFDDEDVDKAAEVCSNSQLYKQAGNSIVVDVLMAIFKEML